MRAEALEHNSFIILYNTEFIMNNQFQKNCWSFEPFGVVFLWNIFVASFWNFAIFLEREYSVTNSVFLAKNNRKKKKKEKNCQILSQLLTIWIGAQDFLLSYFEYHQG
jgi:heme O synthase-like polyprenyltransferase